ncbi:transposase [Roseomonas sp. KE2513]|uniref:transposase n=1 Tax=Roseomonas sp. KE2513 TaxID=2479202 RepID=UPI0018E00ABE|nr:transposase [Roseomonas sp. KE2513]MBI0537257.1 transposase [Roseomonas sp. KE2513]
MAPTDEQWFVLEPLVEACRPYAKVPPQLLRRTVGAILWRHDNGAKWRALPLEKGACWMGAQTPFTGRGSAFGSASSPRRRNEAPVVCPDWLYNNRNRVERLWARLKEWRAVATRYEKTASSFLGVLHLAATLDCLRR